MFIRILSFLKESSDLVFWASALFGTTLFVLRLCATLIGGIGEEFGDSGDTGDIGDIGDIDPGDFDSNVGSNLDSNHEHHKATGSFKLFTLHSMAGFFMMFGWVGLACIKQLEYSHKNSIIIACIAGLIIMILTGVIFKSATLLVSPGTRFDIKKTIGLTGTVYQYIPKEGQGKIQLVIDGVTREILAQSLDHSTIESFKLVKVIKFLDHDIVIVKEINS